jgi:hypothetical protein
VPDVNLSKKLRLKSRDGKDDKVVPIEDARNWVYDDPEAQVVVENYLVHSYYELVDIAGKERFKDKDILDIYSIEAMDGG